MPNSSRQGLYPIGQFQQAFGMQGRSTRRQFYPGISLFKIRPDCRNLAQPSVIIVEIQEAQAKAAPVLNEIKLLAAQRMKRVRDPYLPGSSCCGGGCSREDIQIGGRPEDPVATHFAPAPAVR
jgi:hypothetical protein